MSSCTAGVDAIQWTCTRRPNLSSCLGVVFFVSPVSFERPLPHRPYINRTLYAVLACCCRSVSTFYRLLHLRHSPSSCLLALPLHVCRRGLPSSTRSKRTNGMRMRMSMRKGSRDTPSSFLFLPPPLSPVTVCTRMCSCVLGIPLRAYISTYIHIYIICIYMAALLTVEWHVKGGGGGDPCTSWN